MQIGALLALALLGNTLIYAGLALINARLCPSILSGLYGATTVGTRIVLMEILFAVPANAVFAVTFRMFAPVHASMAILATLVVVMAANAVLLGASLHPRMAAAMAVTLASCAWFAYEHSVA